MINHVQSNCVMMWSKAKKVSIGLCQGRFGVICVVIYGRVRIKENVFSKIVETQFPCCVQQ